MASPGEVTQQVRAEFTGPGGLFELAPATVVHGPTYPKVFAGAPATLAEYYESNFSKFPEREFLVFEEDRTTFQQCDSLTNALARSLEQRFGVKSGDRVSIAMRNYPEWVLSFIAVTRLGAVAVPLNSLWKDSEYEYGLRDSGSNVLICDEERYKMARAACNNLSVEVVLAHGLGDPPPGVATFQAMVKAGAGLKPTGASIVEPDDMAMIMYTSGTTGEPKGVVQTVRGVCNQMHLVSMAMTIKAEIAKRLGQPLDTKQEVIILPVPLFHVTALHHVFLASISLGRKMVMMYKWDAEKALQLIDREKITTFTGVPTMIADMMARPDFEQYDTSSLANLSAGGGPTPQAQVSKTAEKFKAAGNTGTTQGYGLTETNGCVVWNSGENYLARPMSIGQPTPLVDMEVRDLERRTQDPKGQLIELAASTEEAKGTPRGEREDEIAEAASALFQVIGKDGDGELTIGDWMSVFPKIDVDGDGSLTRKEWNTSQGTTVLFDLVQKRNLAAMSKAEWESLFLSLRTWQQVLPAGSEGELFVRSVLNMRGYFNKPEKTAEVLDATGWFATGDIGKIDGEGYVYILDRAKDIIIRAGENVSCAEVEGAFIETGLVQECAAFGLPDERLGEKVALMYVPNAAGLEADVTAKMVREAVVGKIAAFKIPDEEFIFRSDERLPRGATEKIQKRDIREAIVEQLGLKRTKAK